MAPDQIPTIFASLYALYARTPFHSKSHCWFEEEEKWIEFRAFAKQQWEVGALCKTKQQRRLNCGFELLAATFWWHPLPCCSKPSSSCASNAIVFSFARIHAICFNLYCSLDSFYMGCRVERGWWQKRSGLALFRVQFGEKSPQYDFVTQTPSVLSVTNMSGYGARSWKVVRKRGGWQKGCGGQLGFEGWASSKGGIQKVINF